MHPTKDKVFDNCELYSKEGYFLGYIEYRKLCFYLNSGSANKLSEHQIKLNYDLPESALRRVKTEKPLQKKENRCQICGATKQLNKHHVVPYSIIKEASKYINISRKYKIENTVALCLDCHGDVEEIYYDKKLKWLSKFNIPPQSENQIELDKLGKLKKKCQALIKFKDNIPIKDQNRLKQEIEKLMHTLNISKKYKLETVVSIIDMRMSKCKKESRSPTEILVSKMTSDLNLFLKYWEKLFEGIKNDG